MYLLYLDESGSTRPDSDYFVVGGLALHEQDCWPLSQAVEGIANRLPDPARGTELHASPMKSGRKLWRRVPRSARDQATKEMSRLLVHGLPRCERPPVLFAVALHRASVRYSNLYERAYEEFFARCNGFMGRLASANDRHRVVAISDETKHLEAPLQDVMRQWRVGGGSTGARIGRMESYAEVPLFVDSKASRLIQLADFVAYWTYRAYMHGDYSTFSELVPAFDTGDDNRLHGLVHLVGNYRTCACVACRSRR